MAIDVVAVKRELYNQLKDYSGVTGAGIQGKSGAESIVIFITNSNLSSIVPTTFKGIKVKTEVRAIAKAVTSKVKTH